MILDKLMEYAVLTHACGIRPDGLTVPVPQTPMCVDTCLDMWLCTLQHEPGLGCKEGWNVRWTIRSNVPSARDEVRDAWLQRSCRTDAPTCKVMQQQPDQMKRTVGNFLFSPSKLSSVSFFFAWQLAVYRTVYSRGRYAARTALDESFPTACRTRRT